MSLVLGSRWLVATLVVSQLWTCTLLGERPTKVKIEAINPPVFRLSGSGELSVFVIHGPKKQRNIVGDRAYAVWEIKPSRGDENAQSVESLGAVKYGIVPKNYVQVYPENGVPPPPLVGGEHYGYWFQTLNAPEARGYFEIRDGKAVELAP